MFAARSGAHLLAIALVLVTVAPSSVAVFSNTHPVGPSAGTYSGGWTNITAGPLPPTSMDNAMVYDPQTRSSILFGGNNNTADNGYTWSYSNHAWTNLSLATAPSPRNSMMMTYDSADGYLLLFGGGSYPTAHSDTWTFSGDQWTQIHPTQSPPARVDGSMTFDVADNYVLLFGGLGCSIAPSCTPRAFLNDVWTYHAGIWTNITAADRPTPREGAAITEDSEDHYVLLSGGVRPTLLGQYNFYDTWSFKGGAWTLESNGTGPQINTGITDDPTDGYVLAVSDTGETAMETTWAYVGGTWSVVSTSSSLFGRGWPHLVYDSGSSEPLLFGGINGVIFRDTWVYRGTGGSPPGSGSCSLCLLGLDSTTTTFLLIAILGGAVAVVAAVLLTRRRKRAQTARMGSPPSSNPMEYRAPRGQGPVGAQGSPAQYPGYGPYSHPPQPASTGYMVGQGLGGETQAPLCPACGRSTTYLPATSSWYCYTCAKLV